VSFSFFFWEQETGEVLEWEPSANRFLSLNAAETKSPLSVNNGICSNVFLEKKKKDKMSVFYRGIASQGGLASAA
jgi:hypothetical protein